MIRNISDIQKRREKRLLELKKLNHAPYPVNKSLDFYKSKEVEDKYINKIFIKALLSILLLVITFLTFQASHPYAKLSQEFIRESITREFNFDGLYNWYKDKFSGYPAILPTFAIKEKEDNSSYTLQSPISNPPIKMTQTKLGLYLDTAANEAVLSIGKGIVIYVGNQEKLGKTIMIRHQNGFESTYAMLENIDIEMDDWVEPGELIGSADTKMYFAIKNQFRYLNPLDVISFD